jgi:catechol 2,3-dioxygenase-like lactoylglutathione lyase family enzyme
MASEVIEFRVALTVSNYEKLEALYRVGLGLEAGHIWTKDGDKGIIFDAGRATLEIFDEAAAATVDQVEVGQRVSGQVRFAFQVPDVDAAVERMVAHGATLVHAPVETPWRHRNARVEADGLQITLFQVLPPAAE